MGAGVEMTLSIVASFCTRLEPEAAPVVCWSNSRA